MNSRFLCVKTSFLCVTKLLNVVLKIPQDIVKDDCNHRHYVLNVGRTVKQNIVTFALLKVIPKSVVSARALYNTNVFFQNGCA